MMKSGNTSFTDEVTLDDGFEAGDGNSVVAVFECSAAVALDDGSPYVPLRENFAETAFFLSCPPYGYEWNSQYIFYFARKPD